MVKQNDGLDVLKKSLRKSVIFGILRSELSRGEPIQIPFVLLTDELLSEI